MRIIARSRVLGLRGVDVGRIYSLASVKDRKSGASRPICQRAPGVTNYRNIHPRPARAVPWPPLSADETSIRTIAPTCVLGLQGVDVDRVRPEVS